VSCAQYCMVFYVSLAHASHMYPHTSGVCPMLRVRCGLGWEGSDMCHVCSTVWWCCSILAHVLNMYPHTSGVYPVLRTTVPDCIIRCQAMCVVCAVLYHGTAASWHMCICTQRTTVTDCTIRCYVGRVSTQCCAVSFVCMQYELGQLHRAGSNCILAAVAAMRAIMPCLLDMCMLWLQDC
jgi:hypothetical protein